MWNLLFFRMLFSYCSTTEISIELSHQFTVLLVKSSTSLASSELRTQKILLLIHDSWWLSIFIVRTVAGVRILNVLSKFDLIICILKCKLNFFVEAIASVLSSAVMLIALFVNWWLRQRPLRKRIRIRLRQISEQSYARRQISDIRNTILSTLLQILKLLQLLLLLLELFFLNNRWHAIWTHILCHSSSSWSLTTTFIYLLLNNPTSCLI